MIYKPLHPRFLILITLMLVATIIILTSTNWIALWLGFELNIISMLPLIMASSTNIELNATIKYFIIQTLRSALVLLRIIASVSLPSISFVSHNIILFRILAKIGIAPCHYWFPQIINDLSWFITFLILTWQKLGPLLLITHLIPIWNTIFIIAISSINALVGSLRGLNQTQIRLIIAYSSISHSGWILAALSFSQYLTISYFIIYSTISAGLLLGIQNLNKLSATQFNLTTPPTTLYLTLLHLLSLGGLPPLLGFFPKWLVVSALISYTPTLTFVLILSSVIRLIYYLIIFTATIISTTSPLTPSKSLSSSHISSLIISIPIFSIIFIFY